MGGLRDSDWNGKTDPVALAEIYGKAESRIISPTITNTQTPVWNYQEQLKGFQLEDVLEVSIWDDDPGSLQPEDGDFLGKVSIPADKFYPKGMEATEFPLEKNGEPSSASIKMEIVTQDY